MTQITAKVQRIADKQTRTGRMGDYEVQGIMLQPEGEERQSLYGTLFGQNIDVLQQQEIHGGDRMECGLVFTTSERNGFVSNYIEITNPRKL